MRKNIFRSFLTVPYFQVACLFAAAALLIGKMELSARSSPAPSQISFPMQIGEWKGKDLEVDESTYEILETRDVISREYTDPDGDTLYFSLVYAQDTRHSFHPPELCYVGGGVEVMGKEKAEIPLDQDQLTVNVLYMKAGYGNLRAWYWFSAGSEFTDSYVGQQIRLFFDVMRGEKPSGALIRVSTPSPESAPKAESFIRKLIPPLKRTLEKIG
ncbi:MAG: EpsI family protein [Candidatus Omnitrophica bacterium]|nr:EpsI family protein [Candidatus Omnitrophota bacterium]